MREQTLNGKPVEEVSDKRRDLGELCDSPYEADSSVEDGLCIMTAVQYMALDDKFLLWLAYWDMIVLWK